MSPKPSPLPSRSIRASIWIWDDPGCLSKSKTMEGPSAQSLMASPFGKGVEKESLEVSTPSRHIPGCPRHRRAQNDCSWDFLEIQFLSAAGWNDLKCPFISSIFPPNLSMLRSQLSILCVPGSTESFIQGGRGSSSIFKTPSEEDGEDEVSPPQAAASSHILGQRSRGIHPRQDPPPPAPAPG